MKHGFTLIELLAVIVILAIIALIAVPIVINIINDSKNSSDEQTVELYLDTAVKTITKKQLSSSNFNPDKCEIKNDGNLECFKDKNSLGIIEINMKGKIPYSGKIIINNNNKVDYINIMFNGKRYYPPGKLVSDADNNKKISIGDKYTYKVNDTDTFIFYVLSIDGDKISLIMDKNICDDGTTATEQNTCLVAWHAGGTDNSYGPDTAMTYLYNATKNWINVSDMIMNHTDSQGKYTSIITDKTTKVTIITGKNDKVSDYQVFGNSQYPLKARLPKYNEITSSSVDCKFNDIDSCSIWLVDGMLENNVYGYWLLDSYFNGIKAYYIDAQRYVYGRYTNSEYGIRPVITVSTDDLEN